MKISLETDDNGRLFDIQVGSKLYLSFDEILYGIGPVEYSAELADGYGHLVKESAKNTRIFKKSKKELETMLDEDSDYLDPDPDLKHRLGHWIGKRNSYERINGEIVDDIHGDEYDNLEDSEDYFDGELPEFAKVRSFLNKQARTFRALNEREDTLPEVKTQIEQCLTYIDQAKKNYAETISLIEDIIAVTDIYQAKIVDHLNLKE